jgi:hypothetical protein
MDTMGFYGAGVGELIHEDLISLIGLWLIMDLKVMMLDLDLSLSKNKINI